MGGGAVAPSATRGAACGMSGGWMARWLTVPRRPLDCQVAADLGLLRRLPISEHGLLKDVSRGWVIDPHRSHRLTAALANQAGRR